MTKYAMPALTSGSVWYVLTFESIVNIQTLFWYTSLWNLPLFSCLTVVLIAAWQFLIDLTEGL